ncbi:MAG: Glycosyl transferase, group 1 [uncultured Gemmatimonadetes bacterium]|uniref:Glycosyl transferase, group 1 n=1 Tax=uncultured Gemmatimonadota bacterium TaxID=203437 RepID=A0A6J4M8B3_9BACT|nr:MAG: Glycosyl transferase, group 1 [uncultured Gemmatimonadota bacterium]
MSAAPRLLWVNHFAIPPGEGGGTRHFEIGRELAGRGWEVTVAASDMNLHTRRYSRRADGGDRTAIGETIEGVRFLWLWAAPYERNDWRRAVNWLSFGRELLARDVPRADVVIGSSPHLFAALAAERLAARWGVPFLFEVRDLWPESLAAAGKGKSLGYRGLDAIARHLYRRASRIIVLARGTGEYLEGKGIPAGKLAYVPNGVDLNAFGGGERPVREGLTLVYAGAHGPFNGLDTVLGAAELLRGRAGIRFLLVGDGPSKPELVASARARGLGNVEFRDPVAKVRMPGLLAEADAGLMVLREAELFSFGVSPNKLFDYLGAALPVVCNVPGEVAGMLAASGAGVQTADASAAALADAIVRMEGAGPAARRAMGARGREWVGTEHGRDVLGSKLDTLLRREIAR